MISVMSKYFQTAHNRNEQQLLDDLIVESVSINGMNCFYVAQDLNNFNPILGEDDSSSYTKSWMVAVYLKDVFGYAGDRELMSKVAGLEIRDQIILSLPYATFLKEIRQTVGYDRPHQGDLIYFPYNKTIFQIKHVDQNEMFYQLGTLHTWEMTCELFEYSDERFNTGIAAIDRLQKIASTNILDYEILLDDGVTALWTEANNFLLTDSYILAVIDPADDTKALQQGSFGVLDWSADDPFNDNINHNL